MRTVVEALQFLYDMVVQNIQFISRASLPMGDDSFRLLQVEDSLIIKSTTNLAGEIEECGPRCSLPLSYDQHAQQASPCRFFGA